MGPEGDPAIPPAPKLLEIIRVQTAIAEAPLEFERVIQIVAETAQTITDADGAVVELPEGEEMVYRASTGIAAHQLGLRLARAGSLSGLCVEKETPLVCIDSETDPRVNQAACRAVGLRSMIVVPLRTRKRIVGVLKVLKKTPDSFTAEDVATVSLLSGLIAAGMANATQYESQMEVAEALFRRATYDTLTGLDNRASFHDHLRQAVTLARRYHDHFAVALVDMDGLKKLNDTFGHQAGDAALKTLADRLKASCRDSDLVARLGGDEFAVILSRLEDRAAAQKLGAQIVAKVHGSFRHEGLEHPVQASCGVSLFPDDGETPEELLGRADAAMYEMKRARGTGRV